MNNPIPQGFDLKEKVADLEKALLERHPRMPVLLREIHKTLSQYPENVTLLAPEDIRIIVSGLEQQTGIELAKSVVSKSSKSLKSKVNSLDADDL